jgi:hypothetical protein
MGRVLATPEPWGETSSHPAQKGAISGIKLELALPLSNNIGGAESWTSDPSWLPEARGSHQSSVCLLSTSRKTLRRTLKFSHLAGQLQRNDKHLAAGVQMVQFVTRQSIRYTG